jgi:hypothetical protein
MKRCWAEFVLLLVLGCGLSACGLIGMPFRVVGSVAQHSYSAGKMAVTASSEAIENRKKNRAAAKKTVDKDTAKNPAQPAAAATPAAATLPVPAPPPPSPPLGADPATLPPLPDTLPPLPEDLPPLP